MPHRASDGLHNLATYLSGPDLVLHCSSVTNQISSSDIRRYAIAGAEARLAEMTQESAAILRAFPELREDGKRRVGGASTRRNGTESDTPVPRRRRSKMSAAQRKAVGERMKKYWAARR